MKVVKFQNTERNKANVAKMIGYQLNFNKKVFEALKATKLETDLELLEHYLKALEDITWDCEQISIKGI